MTTSDSLQDLLVVAVLGKTGAGDNVFAPRDWPTEPGVMPIVLVQTPSEQKQAASGRNGPASFNTRATIRLIGRVYAKAGTGDAGALAAQSALGIMQRQIEVAVVNNYEIRRAIQELSSIEVTSTVKRDGEYHFGELMMDFAFEFYQPPEDFAPVDADPMDEFFIYADLVNVYSPTGDYSDTEEGALFPGAIKAPPRTSGPDGRTEGVAHYAAPSILDFSDPDNSGLLPPL